MKVINKYFSCYKYIHVYDTNDSFINKTDEFVPLPFKVMNNCPRHDIINLQKRIQPDPMHWDSYYAIMSKLFIYNRNRVIKFQIWLFLIFIKFFKKKNEQKFVIRVLNFHVFTITYATLVERDDERVGGFGLEPSREKERVPTHFEFGESF